MNESARVEKLEKNILLLETEYLNAVWLLNRIYTQLSGNIIYGIGGVINLDNTNEKMRLANKLSEIAAITQKHNFELESIETRQSLMLLLNEGKHIIVNGCDLKAT